MIVCKYVYLHTKGGGKLDVMEYSSFGDMLKHMIKLSEMSQICFYTELGITKPYFYDILSGKVNPPPPKVQFKMANILKLSSRQREIFFEKAAAERNELPADITYYIKDNPDMMKIIRENMSCSNNNENGGKIDDVN